jgi:hypothetical protein
VLNDPGVVVAARQSRWARSRKLKLADLADEAWILPPPDTFPGSRAAQLFRANGLSTPRLLPRYRFIFAAGLPRVAALLLCSRAPLWSSAVMIRP